LSNGRTRVNRVSAFRRPGYGLVVGLGVAMVGVAELLHTRTLVFPEGVALGAGVWVLRRRDWMASPARLVLAVVPCSGLGVLAVRFVGPDLGAQLAALAGAALLLYVLSAPIGPALSAAVLPTVFDVSSWRYPVTVLVVAVVVVGGAAFGRRDPASARGAPAARWPATPLVGACAVGALWLSVVWALELPTVAAAPPLLVSFVELVFGPSIGAAQLVRRACVMTAAWTIGAALAWWLPLAWTGALLALIVATASIVITRVIHPPVLAMSVVVQVSGAPRSFTHLACGAAGVAAAVTVLYALGACVLRPLSARLSRRDVPRSDAEAAPSHPVARPPGTYRVRMRSQR
jgi:hypothetical protein